MPNAPAPAKRIASEESFVIGPLSFAGLQHPIKSKDKGQRTEDKGLLPAFKIIFHLFQLLPIRHLRHRSHAVGDQDAVEMIVFMLPDASEESFADLFERFPLQVLGL